MKTVLTPGSAICAAAGFFLATAVCLPAADSFSNTDWQTVATTANSFGHAMNLVYQGPPPSDDTTTYQGSPCNWASTDQIESLASTKWSGTGLAYFLWANRRNFEAWVSGNDYSVGDQVGDPSDGFRVYQCIETATDDTVFPKTDSAHWTLQPGLNGGANPIGPSGTIRLSQPLDWQPMIGYQVGELVYESFDGQSNWWRCMTAHTSATSFASAEAANWQEVPSALIGNGTVQAPECRLEYSSYANAIASTLAQVRWLAGAPANTDDGSSGYLDAISGTTLTTAGYSDLLAGAGGIFASRASDPASSNPTSQFAVATDIVSLASKRLTDCWTDYTPGASWTSGQLVRDQGNLLPNNFCAYDPSDYTDSASGLNPAASSKTFSGGYCQLTGINQAIRQRYLLPASSGVTYELQVTGLVQVPASTQNGRVRLQVFGLDSDGNEVGDHVEANFNDINTSGESAKPFTFTQKFAATGNGSDVIAWPAGATLLRFSVNANSGLTGDTASIWIQSMTVVVAGTTPAYWRCVTGHTSPASSGDTFATFATDRSGSGGSAFTPQQLAVELDYEVGDGRPSAGVAPAFAALQSALNAGGYKLFVYTNDLDNYSETLGSESVICAATRNGIVEDNIDDILGSCDVLTAVISAKNYRGNSGMGSMAANYNRMQYINGDPDGEVRSNYAPSKIGFALQLPDPGAGTSAPIVAMPPPSGGAITITAPNYPIPDEDITQTVQSGATKNEYISINGLAGSLGGNFNGNVYHVSSTASQDASVTIDGVVTSVDESTGVVTIGSLPSYTSYAGGGVVAANGLASADFSGARSSYFAAADVTHFEVWRDFAVQQPSAPPTPVNVAGITVAGSTISVVTDATVAAFANARVYLDGLPAPFTQLNGGSYFVDAGQANTSPPDGNTGTNFVLLGYTNTTGLSTNPSLSSGTAAESLSQNVNAKISALAGIP